MDFNNQLLKEHSKKNSLFIGDFILNNPSTLDKLILIFMSGPSIYSQRASMVISYVYDSKPGLFDEHKKEIINYLLSNDCSVAVKRCICRMMQTMEIPEKLQATSFDRCIKFLDDPNETVAVRVFCMQVLYNLTRMYLELELELRLVLERAILSSKEAGIQSRGNKILKMLDKS